MDADTDCLPPVTMTTTSTQTDDCSLNDDDEEEVDFTDELDYYPPCQPNAFYDRL